MNFILTYLRDIKIRYRLIGSFLIMAFIVTLTGVFGIWSIKRVASQSKDILQNRANQEKMVLLMEVAQKGCRHNLVEAAMVVSEKEEFKKYEEEYHKKSEQFRSYCATLLKGDPKLGIQAASRGSKVEELVHSVLSSWQAVEKVGDELLAHKAKLLAPLHEGVADAAAKQALADPVLNRLARKDLREASENAKLDIDDLADTLESLMFRAKKDVEVITRSAVIAFVTVIVGAFLIAVALGIISSRNFLGRIKMVTAALERGSEGDLTALVKVDSRDEFGVLMSVFNDMSLRLREMIGNVHRATAEVHQVSGSIYEVSKQIVGTAELQATGVRETSDSVSLINSSIREVGQGVESLSLSASESSASILEMAASVEEVALNMDTLAQAVDEVSSSIIEMTASIREIDNGAVRLMEASTTTASSIAEMDSAIHQVEKNASETATISTEVYADAEAGKSAVEAAIDGMHHIRHASSVTSDVIANLTGRVNDIGLIISVIDEVAEQTNLLALNAAIIAAQAGEHGKGFAVVADEIKELADRTSTSTREIAHLIKAVQEETERAVNAISAAEKSIVDGERLSTDSGMALEKVLEGMRKANSRVNDIARATVEQSKGSRMIRDAMEEVADMVAQIAKATTEQGKGSGLIMTAVERMKGLASQVRISTQEQSKTGGFIARSTENIADKVQHIKEACDEQSRGSDHILCAIDDFRQSTGVNLEAARIMDEAVIRLTRQSDALKREILRFRIEEDTKSGDEQNFHVLSVSQA